MISYKKKTLNNGMQVLTHCDRTTPLVTVNLLYKVGSRNESPDRTGFAHLFEHLMFGGTRRFPDFDLMVDAMGGESNAFTNNDYTNYYITIPAQYLPQALELEADRMRGEWDIEGDDWNVLRVQQRVVTEEYHQRYENQPYGDVWMLLRPLCYKHHPYRWCTIGADIKHVQEASLSDVRAFFERYYKPSNAIMAIAGNIDEEECMALVERTFADIDRGPSSPTLLEREPEQTEPRRLEVTRQVPNDAIYMAWKMCDRMNPDYYAYDMVSDVLSNGNSSRMYQHLVQEQGLFTEVNAYITGELDEGLFVVSGKLRDNITFEQAESAIVGEIACLAAEPISEHEMEKVANKFENTFVYSQYKSADRALNLCYFEMMGQLNLVNDEPQRYREVTALQLQRIAKTLSRERCSTLIIHKQADENDSPNEDLS